MDELKTLKEIDFYEADTQKEIEKRLKAEAVKWVKELYTEIERPDLTAVSIANLNGRLIMLINFFNITEKDLEEDLSEYFEDHTTFDEETEEADLGNKLEDYHG